MGDAESDMDKTFVKIEDVDYSFCICGDKFTTEVHLLDHYSASHSGEFDNFCKIRQLKFSKESVLNINNFVLHSDQRISHQERFHQQSREQLQSSPAVKRPHERSILNVHNSVLHSGQKISHQLGLCPGQSRKQIQSSPDVKQTNEWTPYACGVCEARFFVKGLLIEHMKDHSGDKSYEHLQCSTQISNTSELKINHSTKQRTKKKFVCDTCGSMFRSNILLKEHHSQCAPEFNSQSSSLPLVINVNESSNTCKCYDCKICKYQFLDKQLLLQHGNDLPCTPLHGQCAPEIRCRSSPDLSLISNVDEESNPCSYVCKVCEARFFSQDLLAQHASSEHKNAPQAVAKYGSTDALRLHKDRERNECPFCDKKFVYQYLLTEHMRVHIGEKPFECETCGKKFSDKRAIKLHSLRYHESQKRIECPFCDRKFTYQYLLTEHMRVHTGEKPFECDTCGKKFSHRNAMKQHSLRHHDSEANSVQDVTEEDHARYECPKCDRKFSAMLRLKNHLRAQHNVKSLFTCTSCDSVFDSVSQLKNHYRICTPKNQFSCNLCEAKLCNKNSLKVHLFKHKHGKRFECGVCKKKFAFEYLLREHLPKHTGERNFGCDKCGQNFSYKSYLRYHKRKAHGDGSAANNSAEEELVDDYNCDIQEKEIADTDEPLETQS